MVRRIIYGCIQLCASIFIYRREVITLSESTNQVQRKLKQRHISMIAIGGCIGTGLFMTSGGAIRDAGPGVRYLHLQLSELWCSS